MAKNFDISKIKNEIEKSKREKNMTQSAFGESVGPNLAPKDAFLHGLVEAIKTGRDTVSTNLIKTVDNKASEKAGETPKHVISETQVARKPIEKPRSVEMSPERDEDLFRDLEKRKKSTLVESMQGYINPPQGHKPAAVPLSENVYQQPMLNEAYLAESVKKIVNNHLVENLGPVLEEAINSTIIEMYAVERIKEVLRENKELIKGVVVEVIKEIQAKAKAKAQQ
jgi:hypothetical protein